MLLALPNLPVYRHRDDDPDPDEKGALERIETAVRMTACDEDENPTIDCIVLDRLAPPVTVPMARYWSGVHMTENDVIEWAKSTGMGKEQPRPIIAALAHLRCLGHKITVLPECEAEPANVVREPSRTRDTQQPET